MIDEATPDLPEPIRKNLGYLPPHMRGGMARYLAMASNLVRS